MEDFGFAVSATETLVIEDSYYNMNRKRKSYTAWLQIDGKNVGMLRYLVGGETYDVPAICDIEIREDFRGQKLGLKLIGMVEEFIIGEKLYTSGGFTPEGFRAFAGVVPVYPDLVNEELKVKYGSMSFIHSWDNFQTEY